MASDFAAGCIGGIAGVIVGHPFDTVKVRIQTGTNIPAVLCSTIVQQQQLLLLGASSGQNQLTCLVPPMGKRSQGTFGILKSIAQAEGPRALFRGMSSPLAGVAAISAVGFGVYGNVLKALPNPDHISNSCIAAISSGIVQSFVCCPVELVKTRMQTSSSSSNGSKSNPTTNKQIINQIYNQQGVRGFYRGLGLTLARDVPGIGVYFMSYEYMTRSNRDSYLCLFMSGGVAGVLSWIVSYPQDVIKTRLQASNVSQYTSVKHCIDSSIKKDGHQVLFRGLGAAVIRAFPVNAVTLGVTTSILQWMNVFQDKSTKSVDKPTTVIKSGPRESDWRTTTPNLVYTDEGYERRRRSRRRDSSPRVAMYMTNASTSHPVFSTTHDQFNPTPDLSICDMTHREQKRRSRHYETTSAQLWRKIKVRADNIMIGTSRQQLPLSTLFDFVISKLMDLSNVRLCPCLVAVDHLADYPFIVSKNPSQICFMPHNKCGVFRL